MERGTVTDSEELVGILLERNADHLRQATTDGTPFATGTSEYFVCILIGSIESEKIRQWTSGKGSSIGRSLP